LSIEPAPTQPYIETDPVPSPSQPYTEETSSEAETILSGPITMVTESVHSVSDPVPSPTQPYTTEEPGPLTMANEIVHGDCSESPQLSVNARNNSAERGWFIIRPIFFSLQQL
jgi:hypothetical protein